jgi:hypothetical protein
MEIKLENKSTLEIPGLVSIEENENGSLDIILEDDKIEEFYNFFGLQVGDDEALQQLIIEALNTYIAQNSDTLEGDSEEDDS